MPIRVGCHLSIKNGFDGAAQTALTLGCGAFQYFPKNPRSLTVKAFDEADAARCSARSKANGLQSVAHSPYLVNLATEDPNLAEATRKSLLNDLAIAEASGSVGVVVHFGKYSGNDPLQGYKNIIKLLDETLKTWIGGALLLIENQASGIGTTLEELVQIRSLSQRPEGIGFCFDTCHAFAAGLWNGHNWDRIAERGLELGYFHHLKTIHLNDSRYPSGSNKDFHANIGRGHIGDEAFRSLLRSDAVRGLPFILETPENPDMTVQQEIRHVKELAE